MTQFVNTTLISIKITGQHHFLLIDGCSLIGQLFRIPVIGLYNLCQLGPMDVLNYIKLLEGIHPRRRGHRTHHPHSPHIRLRGRRPYTGLSGLLIERK
ncbi:hypothetical protein M9H77_02490 [Catharanthus roseus]|uniref:Uncharacterized protein n=1 Tax=Catharanthus roseus TaxID=4058 RepID=A0ACC0C8F9_CATRO|nr:hypothetical protein M9H77_02490 [Catharanthus roseus]